MSYTRSESERLARLRCTAGGIVCRYQKYTYQGVTGPTGPPGSTTFPTIVTGSTGAMLILGSTGGSQTVQYTTLLQASQQAYPNNAAPAAPYLRVTGDIIPSQTNTYNLGNTGIQFKSAYFSGNTIYLDNVPIGSTGGNTLVFPTNIQLGNTLINISGGDTLILPDKVQFRSGGTLTSGTQGTTGPTGPPDASANLWIERNARAQSPAVVFETVTNTSSAIYIPWKYPDQERLAFVNIWVPATNNVSATVSYIPAGGSITTAAPFTAASGTQYIDVDGVRYTNIAAATHITGLILSNVASAGTGYLQGATFPHDGTVRNAYRVYNADFANLAVGTTMTVSVWYSNFSTAAPNKASTICNIFLQPTGPSEPRNLVGNTTGPFSSTVNGNRPLKGETGDAASTATITRYEFVYTTPGSANRYGGPLDHSGNATAASANGATFTQSLAGLVPDATYTVTAAAVNSFGITGATATTTFTTQPPAVPVNITGTIDPAAVYNGTFKTVASNTPIAPAVLVKGAAGARVDTTALIVPVHGLTNRGSAAGAIAELAAVLLDAGVTGAPAPRRNYDGFPAKSYTAVADGDLEISGGVAVDTQSARGATGFYLAVPSRATMTLGAVGDTIAPSPNEYVLRLLQTRAATTTQLNLPFRYDGPPQPAPTIRTLTGNISVSTTHNVSGITAIRAFNNYQITTVADNMGGYYYKDPIIAYASTLNSNGVVNTSEADLSNFDAASFTSGTKDKLASQITCQRNTVPFSLATTTYFTTLDINVTVQNATGSAVSRVSQKVVVDEPSRLLLAAAATKYKNRPTANANEFTYSPAAGSTLGLVGNHIPSGVSRGAAGAATNIHVTDFSDNIAGYDHTVTISGTEELQIYNGLFRSRPYIDYSSHYGNAGRDYSALTSPNGYRYATFVWGYIGGATPGRGLSFNIRGPSMSSQLFVGADNYAHVGSESGPLLQLYYRIVQKGQPLPSPTASLTFTTIWANANDRSVPQLASGTYYFPADNSESKSGLTSQGIVIDATKATFNVTVPVAMSDDAWVYLRIGAPVNSDFNFEYVTADIGQ